MDGAPLIKPAIRRRNSRGKFDPIFVGDRVALPDGTVAILWGVDDDGFGGQTARVHCNGRTFYVSASDVEKFKPALQICGA